MDGLLQKLALFLIRNWVKASATYFGKSAVEDSACNRVKRLGFSSDAEFAEQYVINACKKLFRLTQAFPKLGRCIVNSLRQTLIKNYWDRKERRII